MSITIEDLVKLKREFDAKNPYEGKQLYVHPDWFGFISLEDLILEANLYNVDRIISIKNLEDRGEVLWERS